jgi:hypothetical protein
MHDRNYRDPRLPASGPYQNGGRAGRQNPASGRASARLWLALIGTLYASSLPAAAFSSPGPRSDPTPGLGCLIMIPWVMFSPAWWANPMLLAGCLFLRRGNHCGVLVCGIVAVALAATFPIQHWLWKPSEFFRTDAWRHDFGMMIAGLRVGYWLWLLSMVTLLSAALVMSKPQSKDAAKISGFEDLWVA